VLSCLRVKKEGGTISLSPEEIQRSGKIPIRKGGYQCTRIKNGLCQLAKPVFTMDIMRCFLVP